MGGRRAAASPPSLHARQWETGRARIHMPRWGRREGGTAAHAGARTWLMRAVSLLGPGPCWEKSTPWDTGRTKDGTGRWPVQRRHGVSSCLLEARRRRYRTMTLLMLLLLRLSPSSGDASWAGGWCPCWPGHSKPGREGSTARWPRGRGGSSRLGVAGDAGCGWGGRNFRLP